MKMDEGEVKSRRHEDGGADRTSRAAGHGPLEGVNVALQEVAPRTRQGLPVQTCCQTLSASKHQRRNIKPGAAPFDLLIHRQEVRARRPPLINNPAETLITGSACSPLAPHSIIHNVSSNQSLGRPEGGLTPPAHRRLHQHLWGFTSSRGPRFIKETPT